ncbi:hypothetical protein [Zhaonella formicivorans]|nr:hypothetical protein [Zhaonella formicivorans]
MAENKKLYANHDRRREVKLKDLNRERGFSRIIDPERGPENR